MITIPLPELFSVEWMLNHIRTSSYGVPYRFVDKRILQRPLRLSGGPVVAEFDLSTAGRMGVRLVSPGGEPRGRGRRGTALMRELETEARFLWGLDDAIEGHQRAMAADPELGQLLKRFGALRIVRAPDLYEALLVAVLGQQVSVQAAQAIRRRLMRTLGTRIAAGPAGGEDHYLYPSPQELLAAGEPALRGQGVSRQKARYLLEIAGRASAGELDRETFAGLSDEVALARLCEIRGVGRWTAEIVLIRGLGRPDVFPAADLGLQVAVQEQLRLPERPQEKALRAMAEHWRGWRSYAAFYLWMTLQSRAL